MRSRAERPRVLPAGGGSRIRGKCPLSREREVCAVWSCATITFNIARAREARTRVRYIQCGAQLTAIDHQKE